MGIMNLGEMFDNAVEAIKKNFGTIIIYLLAYVIIFVIVAIVSLIILGIGVAGSVMTMKNSSSAGVTGIVIVSGIIVLICVAIASSIKIGIIKIGCQEVINEKVKAYEAVKCSFRNIFRVFGIVIIELIMCSPLIALYVYLIVQFIQKHGYGFIGSYIFNMSFADHIMLILRTLKIGFVFIFFILFSLFLYYMLSTFFTFSMQALVIEKKGIIRSVGRSFYLIKHNYWKVLGFNVMITLTVLGLQCSLQSFIGIVGSIVYIILRFLNINVNYIQLMTVNLLPLINLLSRIVTVVVYPLSIFATTNMYLSLMAKKEGYDIALKLDKIKQIEGN